MILKMINLFSIFDPTTSINFRINWLRRLIIILIIPFQFWLIPSRLSSSWLLLINYIFKEFKILIYYSYSNIILFIRLIIFIIINNFIGLFPYIFTASRHIRICLSLSLTLWIRVIIYNIINYLNDLFTHLTPQGTPNILIPFIVIIESIRLLIRPLTLSVRLTANIITGHLLFSLLGKISHTFLSILIILSLQILLFILEITVSLLQAYVFSILSALYRREI